jgi:hypothetical protein
MDNVNMVQKKKLKYLGKELDCDDKVYNDKNDVLVCGF